ncbi:MAG: hypothetical protein O7F75_09180 [Alphaproteobacteria bacterium]|nr:hypothetical protein [Alphaproteobacteria bacterium]
MRRRLVAAGLALAMALAAASGPAVAQDKAAQDKPAQDEAVAGLDGGSVRGFIWPQSARGTGATIYRITAMSVDLKELTDHDHSDECPVCRAQNIVRSALLPAASAWEATDELPRFSVALQGAAELLGVMLEEGISREDIESALGQLLDDIELRNAEDKALGGPPMGSA